MSKLGFVCMLLNFNLLFFLIMKYLEIIYVDIN